MWRLILTFLLCLSGLIQGQEVLRLVTWNLQWFPGGKPTVTQEIKDHHFLQVAEIIPQFQADVIVLQEVRDDAAAQALAKLMPKFQVHVTSRFKDSFGGAVGLQQISILSNLPAEAAWAEEWASGWANAPRGYAYAKLKTPKGPLHVYGLHLKSNLGDAAQNTAKREDAAEQLLSHIESQTKSGEAVVIAGDFNTSKDDPRFAGDRSLGMLEKAGFFWTFEGIPHADRITIPGNGRYPDACFDHIFTRDLNRPVATVKRDTPGSDHFPVVIDLVQ